MNLLFTVCGRAGSKGVKNKNIRNFMGKPLPLYTFSAIDLFIKENGHFYNDICVSLNTDSVELKNIARNTPLDVIIVERKLELAGDTVAKLDVIRDTLVVIERLLGKSFDIVVDLDITSPIRTVEDIKGVIDSLKENSDLAFSVTEARRNPYFNMVREENGFFVRVNESSFVARQQAPEIYDMNASIYAYKSEFLRDASKQFWDGQANVYRMIDTGILDIDSEMDMELMEIIAKYFNCKSPLISNVLKCEILIEQAVHKEL